MTSTATAKKKDTRSVGEILAEELNLTGKMKLDVNSHTVKAPKNSYEKSLEHAGLDLTTAKKVQEHDMEFMAAMTVAGGRLVADTYKDKSDLGEVQLSYQAGTVDHQVFYKPGAEEAEERVRTVSTHHDSKSNAMTSALDIVGGFFDGVNT